MAKTWLVGVCLSVASLGAQTLPGRYIVELAGEPAASTQAEALRARPGRRTAELADAPEVVARRAAIGAAQQRTARAIQARGGRVLGAVDTALNALFVQIDDRQAGALARIPGVLRVSAERRVHARLDRVLALSKVPEAWQRIGGAEKAGSGIRVAILDSGIDAGHPGFNPEGFTAPEGFPKVSSAANEKYVTAKVIVARSYEDLAGDEGYGTDGIDKNGHGTNAACAAACVIHAFNQAGAQIAGAAPRAYLGAYKVLGNNGGGSEAAILKGIDDAMKDGFDVLNLSLGTDMPGDPDNDAQVKALNAAVDAGYIVAVAAGNAGPDENTINSPGTAAKVMTVGSSSSDRAVGAEGLEAIDPNRLSDFSSRGPNPGSALKPDLVAVGDNFLTAQTREKGGEAYTITQGTSFATPTVAGAAATLKGARPGLTAAQYQSLLVNSASPIVLAAGGPAPIRHQGAGRMNLDAALQLPVAFAPTSLKIGVGGDAADWSGEVTVTNVTDAPVTLTAAVQPFADTVGPVMSSPDTVELAGKESAVISLKFAGSGLAGEHQGVIVVKNNRNEVEARVPYWYGVRSAAKAITLLEFKGEGSGTIVFGARVVDGAGIDVPDAELAVTTDTPGAAVSEVARLDGKPGVFGVALTLAAGENSFVFRSGEVSRTVTITGK
jgi:subtilisin family serine protease